MMQSSLPVIALCFDFLYEHNLFCDFLMATLSVVQHMPIPYNTNWAILSGFAQEVTLVLICGQCGKHRVVL